jgi:hypothetical protein
VRVPAGGSDDGTPGHDEHPDTHIHMPDPSYFPALAAVGMAIMAWSVFTGGATLIVTLGIGTFITVGALFAWAFEPSAEEAH